MFVRSTSALVVALLVVPVALAVTPVPVNALINPGFDQFVVASLPPITRPVLDQCVGVGHQVFDIAFTPWGDWVLQSANEGAADPNTLVTLASDPGFADQATGFPLERAPELGRVSYVAGCPNFNDLVQVNAWEKSQDTGFGWSNDPGTKFIDLDGNGDLEAVIPKVPAQHTHNLWQVTATPQQAMSADFGAFGFTVEGGAIPAGANNQIGLSLSPGFSAHPFVGAFWEGAILFRASDMVPDANGVVRMDPVMQGEIICPADYAPCESFRADFDASDAEGRRAVLGLARVVQVSFWSFSGGVGPVAIDDVTFVAQKTAPEGIVASV